MHHHNGSNEAKKKKTGTNLNKTQEGRIGRGCKLNKKVGVHVLRRKARRSRCSSHRFSSNLIYIPLKNHLKATTLLMIAQLIWLFTTPFPFPSLLTSKLKCI